MSNSIQSLQIKLAFDEGLQKTWDTLTQEYEALDKASIVRLALNTLAKQVRKPSLSEEQALFNYIAERENSSEGMTENDFFAWWNAHK